MAADDGMTRADLIVELEALKRRQGMAQALFNATQDLVYLIDPDGQIMDLNEAAARSLGQSREELLRASNTWV